MINFREHFELQDRLNRVINTDWLTAGYRWSDAAMVEAVEAFDHLAWKWWKKGVDNMPQFRLELVDIWHFILSDTLDMPHHEYPEYEFSDCVSLAVIDIEGDLHTHHRHAQSGDLRQMLRLFIASCAEGVIPTGVFFRLCELAELSLPELDRMYRAKGVLNLFRQANGYKDGTYVKDWAGREDNAWLETIMEVTPDATADQLLDQLSKIYHDVTSGASYLAISARAFVNNVKAGASEIVTRYDGTVQCVSASVTLADSEIGFVALDRRIEGCGKCSDAERAECGGTCHR